MVEFLRKFENRGIKDCSRYLDSYHLIYKFTVIYFNCVRLWGFLCHVDIFKLTASAQSIYREVYGVIHHLFLVCFYWYNNIDDKLRC